MVKLKRHSAISQQTLAHNQWLTTFNDMITLLMVFFVLLFSMGHMDVKRFNNFQNGLQSAMGVMSAGRFGDEGLISDSQWDAEKSSALSMASLQNLPDTSGLEAEYTRKGIKLTLNDELLFQSGSAEITGQGIELLKKIGLVIKPMNRLIRIEGHSDNRPIATDRYPSNWELSAARAVNVAKFFTARVGIAPAFLSAAGYGSFKPKASNDSEVNRAVNRRVEIILGQEAATAPNI